MSTIERAKKDKYVGIVIHANAMLFSNGITQNAYFIYQCLTQCGFKCKFLCNEEVTKPFAHKGIPVKQMSTNPDLFNASEFHTIISATRNVPADMKPIFKKHRTRIIAFVCGNHYMQDNLHHRIYSYYLVDHMSFQYILKNHRTYLVWL